MNESWNIPQVDGIELMFDYIDKQFNKKIIDVTTKPLGVGEGFLSNLLLWTVVFSDNDTFKFVSKSQPKEHDLLELIAECHRKELAFYRNTKGKFTCTCETYTDLTSNTIFLEYLENYSIPSFVEGLTEDEATLTVSEIAKFHAQSWVYPNEIKNPHPWCIKDTDYVSISLFTQNIKLVNEFIGQEKYDKIAKLFNKLEEQFQEYLVLPESTSLSRCVSHGDFWCNNIMINKQSKSCKIIDWQFVGFQNGLADLGTLLSTSTNVDLRKTQEKQWLTTYYNNLESSGVKSSLFSFETCWEEYTKSKVHALLIFIVSFDAFVTKENAHNLIPRFLYLCDEVMQIDL